MIVKNEPQQIITLGTTVDNPNMKAAKAAGITLEDLKEKADMLNLTAKDYKIDTSKKKISFTDDISFKVRDQNLNLTEHAFGQVCTLLGVPSKYMKKCIECNKINLFQNNVKEWSKEFDKELNVRTNKGIIRAIVSQNYVPYDNNEVIDDVASAIKDSNINFVPVGAYINEDRINIRLIDIDNPFYVNGDDSPMYIGVNISNSNIGTSSTSIKFFIYRQWCKNGCTVTKAGGTLYRQTHAGTENKFTRRLKFFSAIQNIEYLRDAVIEALNNSNNEVLKESEILNIIERMKKEVSLSEKASETILEVAQGKYGSTKYGLINGITEVAQSYESLDTRLQLEEYAGKLLIAK